MLEQGHNATQIRDVPNLTDLGKQIEEHGFAIVPSRLDHGILERLSAHFGDGKHALRDLLSMPVVRELAASEPVRALVDGLLGPSYFAVKGIFLNKTTDSNWKVVWHQDLTIMVQERREVDRFGPWTIKAGIPHVQPPAEIMGRILAMRLHLDERGWDNGPLRVIPGSHREGRLSSEEIAKWQNRRSVVCTVPRGGALLMRPLILHASSACVVPKPRRVIHLEFAAEELPEGLQWHDRV